MRIPQGEGDDFEMGESPEVMDEGKGVAGRGVWKQERRSQ